MTPEIQLDNIEENEVVHQRLLLITGRIKNIPDNFTKEIRVVSHHGDDCGWPILESKFKALVPLVSGKNSVFFRYLDLAFVEISINYLPLVDNPPIKLAILIASDSDLRFDAMCPGEDCGINSAVEKLRMVGYMWQAFIGEEMRRAGFGRRSIRFQEVWERDTLTLKPRMGNTADILIVRTPATMKQIRDVDIAQQYKPGHLDPPIDTSKRDLFRIFEDAIRDHPLSKPGQESIIAGLILDTQWDKCKSLIRGHAALGGGNGTQMLGIFGSHCTHAWPSCLEEVAACFSNHKILDQQFVADEKKGKGKVLDAASIGIGAFLHEVGHALGLPHTPHGIMARGFEDLDKAFLPLEEEHSAHFHPTSLIRLGHHPALALPSDPRFEPIRPSFFATSHGIQASHTNGLTQMILWDGETILQFEQLGNVCTFNWELARLVSDQKSNVDLEVCSVDGSSAKLENIVLFHSQSTLTTIPSAFLGQAVGHERPPDAIPFQIVFQSTGQLLRVIYGNYVDGFEVTPNSSDPSFNIGGINKNTCSVADFNLDAKERLIRVDVRAGCWVDAIRFFLSSGHYSEWLGGNGGSITSLSSPPGNQIIGLHGYASKSLLFAIGIIYAPY